MRKRREAHKSLTFFEGKVRKAYNRWPTTHGRIKIVKENNGYNYRLRLPKGWFRYKDDIIPKKNEP